jgi:hypothetical protein
MPLIMSGLLFERRKNEKISPVELVSFVPGGGAGL